MSFRQGARQFFERRGVKLPYDAEVEYLENTGVEYIETGIYHYSPNAVRFRLRPPTTAVQWGGAFAAWHTDSGPMTRLIRYARSKTDWLFYHASPSNVRVNNIVADSVIEAVTTPTLYTINGVGYVHAVIAPVTCPDPMVLFCNSPGASSPASAGMRLYSFAIDNQIDLIPVRKDGVGYMFDRISGQLFGTPVGAFTWAEKQ